jgi:hypothetical protein
MHLRRIVNEDNEVEAELVETKDFETKALKNISLAGGSSPALARSPPFTPVNSLWPRG